MQLVIEPDGAIRCIYSEKLPLMELGQLTIRRGSYVEPDEAGRWIADLSPVQGPRLGPFKCRSDALAAEAGWLEQYWL